MTEKHKMRDLINKIFKTVMFRGPASKHLKLRKLAPVALAFTALINLLTPKMAMAAAPLLIAGAYAFAGWAWGLVGEALKWAAIVAGISYLLMQFAGVLLGIAGTFANWMIQPAYIISSTVVLVGWGVTRDLANMLFILILLGVALDYILFQSFGVKRALPMLIVVALLINFSLPIAGIFIDFSNVFSNFFITKITGSGCSAGQSCGFTEVIANNLNLTSLWSADSKTDVIINMFFSIFLMLGTAFVLFALGIMFLLRTGWLYALLILLPLVLVLMPFPKTSQYFGRWTNQFFKWTMFAPIALFFLYLSMLIFTANMPNLDELGKGYAPPQATSLLINSATAATPPQGVAGGFIEQVIKYVIVWFFMLGSLMAAQSMSITGAGAAYGMIKGAQKWVGGKVKNAGKKVGGATARRAGLDTKMDKMAEWTSKNKVLNTLGVGRALRGAAVKTESAIKQQGRLSKEEKENYEKYNDERLMSEYKSLEESKLPYAQAKAAQVAEMLTKRGAFRIKKTDGTIDTEKTQELAIKAYGFAKTHKDKDAMKFIRKSNPIAYQKIVEKEYGDAEKEGKVIRFADPKTGQEFRRHTETGKTLEEAQNKAFDEMTTADFENLKGQWDQVSVEKFFTSGAMTSGHLRAANISGDHAFLNHVAQAAQSEENLAALKSKSPSFYNYLASGKVDEFGIQVPPDIVKKLEKEKAAGYQGEKRQHYEAVRASEERWDRDRGEL